MSQAEINGNDEERTDPVGLPTKLALARAIAKSEAAYDAVDSLSKSLKTTADGVLVLHELHREAMGAIAKVDDKVSELALEVRKARLATMPPPPPMRGEASSQVYFRELAERAVSAVKEGLESPTKNPEDEVRRVFAEEEDKRELARRRKDDERRKERISAIVDKAAWLVLAGSLGWLGRTLLPLVHH